MSNWLVYKYYKYNANILQVGVCLILFVRSSLLNSVRDLAIGEVKTGMGGATGNKGSIAVRLTVNCTSICFVCSHFAAGQNEVVARNSDFHTAMKRIRFPLVYFSLIKQNC